MPCCVGCALFVVICVWLFVRVSVCGLNVCLCAMDCVMLYGMCLCACLVCG